MSANEQLKEALAEKIKGAVASVFESKINAKIDEKYGEDDEDMDDEDTEEVEESDDEDEDMDDSDEDEDDSDEDDSDELEEAMKLQAVYKKEYKEGKNTPKTIKNHQELVKLANTGGYEWFMVTKANGEEKEYTVDFEGKKPKLVEM